MTTPHPVYISAVHVIMYSTSLDPCYQYIFIKL